MSIQNGDKKCLARRHFVTMASMAPIGLAAFTWAREGAAQYRADTAQKGHGVGPMVPYTVDTRIRSENQDARIRSLVLHYTAASLADSLATLTQPAYQVSAHYLVPDNAFATHVYQLVSEQERAWHAGVSQWQQVNQLNYSSIGIEIVNLGFPPEDERLMPMLRRWYPFDAQQIAVVGALSSDIIRRYAIAPHRVIGHADIAPGRKWDPGPLFPWQALYERYNVGAWPDKDVVSRYMAQQPFDGNIGTLQAKLAKYGYVVSKSGVLDQATKDVITSFQMHFRPQRYDGVPDTETSAILDALLAKYFSPALGAKAAVSSESSLLERDEKGD